MVVDLLLLVKGTAPALAGLDPFTPLGGDHDPPLRPARLCPPPRPVAAGPRRVRRPGRGPAARPDRRALPAGADLCAGPGAVDPQRDPQRGGGAGAGGVVRRRAAALGPPGRRADPAAA